MKALSLALTALIVALPRPVEALHWTRVEEVPAGNVFSVQRYGTTVYAGSANVVYVGAGEGTSWTPTSSVGPVPNAIETIVPAGGALWAGTYLHGVYRSTNGGASWDPINTGLNGLGANGILGMVEKSGHLYAGTAGAGVFVLDLATPTHWSPFNAGLPVLTAGTVEALVLHGTTLLAPAGPNGYVYRFPEGALEWQEVAIVPPIAPGLLPRDLIQEGDDLLIGTSNRVYRSSDDAQTWTFAGKGLAPGSAVFLASSGSTLFAGVDSLNNHRLYRSVDRGDSWQEIDIVLGVVLYSLEVAGDRLFAARTDGLWWTPLQDTPVERMTWSGIKSRFLAPSPPASSPPESSTAARPPRTRP